MSLLDKMLYQDRWITTMFNFLRGNKKTIKKFFLIVGSISGIYLILAFAVTMSLLARSNEQFYSLTNPHNLADLNLTEHNLPEQNNVTAIPEIQPREDEDEGNFLRPPSRTNVLILGIDEFNLADTLMVASFERDTGNIHILNIPRDTYTQPSQEIMDIIHSTGSRPGSIMRINAMRVWGRQYGLQIMKQHLTETLGIPIHYYVEVHLDAFREVVDILGGVEIEVPRTMRYIDPDQDLWIDIPPGIHLMDGQMAENFVRYRGYANADIGRISAQHQFMTQLFRQVLQRETVTDNLVALARTAIRHVNTDIGVDLLRYIPYVDNLSPDRIFTYTLPGHEERRLGMSMWIPDPDATLELISRIFFGIYEDEEEAVPALAIPSVSQDARISVLNGADIGGIARTLADEIEMEGYNVVNVNLYSGTRQFTTRIIVREYGLGTDLVKFFESATIHVDEQMSDDYDIIIIVGRGEH